MRKKMVMLATALGVLAGSFTGMTPATVTADTCPLECRRERMLCRSACGTNPFCIEDCENDYRFCCSLPE